MGMVTRNCEAKIASQHTHALCSSTAHDLLCPAPVRRFRNRRIGCTLPGWHQQPRMGNESMVKVRTKAQTAVLMQLLRLMSVRLLSVSGLQTAG